MSEHADRLVLEYLSRANDIAQRHLGSRERIDFLTRLRQRIEEYRARAGGATEPEQVRKVLARFGDPEALVLRERRRLDAAEGTAGGDAPAAAPGGARRTTSGGEEAGAGGGEVDVEGLFGRRPLEVGAIALTGVGGLLLPVPLWIFGAVAGALSRVWTTREKVIGLVAPPLVAIVAATASGGADALSGLGTGDVPPVLRLAGPVGAGYLAWRLLRAVGARTVRITRARARRR